MTKYGMLLFKLFSMYPDVMGLVDVLFCFLNHNKNMFKQMYFIWSISNATWTGLSWLYIKIGDESSPAERGLGVWVDGKLNVSQLCALADKRASPVLGCINHSITNQTSEVTVSL